MLIGERLAFNSGALVLVVAAILDYWIGDPWNWPHPVRVMGWCIHAYTQGVFRYVKHPAQHPTVQRGLGVVLGVSMIVGSGWVGWQMVRAAYLIHPIVGMAIASILVASGFAARSLRIAANEVLGPLSAGNIVVARSKLGLYVGRDTHQLSSDEILRATLETVTENATDGVMAPLFYAILGALLPMGSVPLVLAYKAVSTLDSMVGYRDAPYTHIGWFSARLDDGLTWLPCRLTVLTIALLSGRPVYILHLCQRDAPADPSPNAGWSECAYAATLGVQVGGTNWYQGIAKPKPLLGEATQPITSAHIYHALDLTRLSFLIWLGLAIALIHFR